MKRSGRGRDSARRERALPAIALGVLGIVLGAGCSGSTERNRTPDASGDSGSAGLGGSASSGASGGGTAMEGGAAGAATTAGTSSAGSGATCAKGELVCEADTALPCDGQGGFGEPIDCAASSKRCVSKLGCVECEPGAARCDGNDAHRCRTDGSGYDVEVCDPLQGTSCSEETGRCQGPCSKASLGDAYIGCDYFPTVTANQVNTDYHFAVAVSNTTAQQAQVTITRGSASVTSFTVAPSSVEVRTLPWVMELKGSVPITSSVLVPEGAYRLRTDQPVTVYQFSPLEYTMGGSTYSASNDASLLLPVSSWSGKYWVVARHNWGVSEGANYRGFYTVTAAYDGTEVSVTPGPIGAGILPGVSGIDTLGRGTVKLDAGDVFSIYTEGLGTSTDPADVTGTLVVSNKSVQVIGGHQCTNVPDHITYCDHLEESMFPAQTLATSYFVTAPLIPDGTNQPKVEMVRIVATQDATSLSYEPPQPGAPTLIAEAGGWVEIAETNQDFRIKADKPVSVAQYMEGQNAGGGAGDPAMALTVTESQFRTNYLIHAPTHYPTNFINIVAPDDATVTVDGVTPPTAPVPIGATGYSLIRMPLSNDNDGNHRIVGSKPVGVTVYGYGQVTSYWYPGGLNLEDLSRPSVGPDE